MTRLIHMAGYETDQRGSFVPFLLAVLSAARARGWDAEAIFPPGARRCFWLADFEDAGIKVHFAAGSRREMTRELGRRLVTEEPTIVHTHFTEYDVAAALVTRRRPSLHVYWHVHTILSGHPARIAANFAKFRFLGRHVDRILAPAANVATSLVRRGAARREVEVFPSSIDLAAFPMISAARRAELRAALDVPDGAEVLLHFGRDWHIKGGQVFLDALAILAAEGRPVFGLFNQGGADARGYVEERGLGDRVKFVPLLPEPQSLYGAADVLLAPSRGEAMPFVVVESLSSGTPVVASDLPGHRFLGDELDACAVVSREPRAFAAAARAFLASDPAERARARARARAWIGAELDVQIAARRLIADYERCLGMGFGPLPEEPR